MHCSSGKPGAPISTSVPHHSQSLSLTASGLATLDHELHIVPSVVFFVNIPESIKDSFFQGKPFVTLKDKVTQPSHTLRHSLQLDSIIHTHFSKNDRSIKPLAIVISNGGPDHHFNFLSVQVALICLLRLLILTVLFVSKHALISPGKTWRKG